MNERPVVMQWDNDDQVMRPTTPYQARIAGELFKHGERYPLIEHQERSQQSHDHYFAALGNIWLSLPDEIGAKFPTAEHMRKHGLIRTGWADSRSITCSSKAEARRVAVFVAAMDEYAVLTFEGTTITVWTAKSQSYRAMGKKDFQKSKDQVLDWASDLVGTTKEQIPEGDA